MEITTVGDIPDALYIVTVGVVCVVMYGEQVFEAKKGDVFGENAMLDLSLDVRRQRMCIEKTMCELCRLDKMMRCIVIYRFYDVGICRLQMTPLQLWELFLPFPARIPVSVLHHIHHLCWCLLRWIPLPHNF